MAGKKRTVTQTELIEDDELDGAGEDQEGEAGGRLKRSQPMDIKGLPEGVKAILRLKPWRDVSEYSAYIYKRVPDPLKPGRIAKKFCERVYNTEIEESWLQVRYPEGGRFHVIYQLPHPKAPGDVQMAVDDYELEPSKIPGALAAPSAGMAPPAVQTVGGDLASGIANLEALTRIVVMLKGGEAANAAAPAPWLEKMYQEKIKRLDELEEKLQRKISSPVEVHKTEPMDELAGWPDFLRPFVPHIKEYGIKTLDALGAKLMGNGPMSAGLRFMVLRNAQFKATWNDPAKREAAAAAIIQALGEPGENLVKLLAEEMAAGGGAE